MAFVWEQWAILEQVEKNPEWGSALTVLQQSSGESSLQYLNCPLGEFSAAQNYMENSGV